MTNREFESIVENIYSYDSRYKEDAYVFVMEALAFTQRKIQSIKHVTGDKLLEGIKELLLQKYGPMTMTVLQHWGIHTTEDFGNIVFNLVENRVLSKSTDDTVESFRNGFSFDEVFNRGYRKQLHQKISRMRGI